MKKIYVMAAFLGVTTFAFNQANQRVQEVRVLKKSAISVATTTPTTDKNNFEDNYSSKAAGTVYFNSDFSDQTDWVVDGDGDQGAWEFGDVADCPSYTNGGSQLTSPLKTAPGDDFAWFDGVQFLIDGPVENQNAWLQMAAPVDLSGETVVALRFTQSYVPYNYDHTYVDISLDGGATWTSTEINADVQVFDEAEKTLFDMRFTVNGESDVLFRFRLESELDPDPANAAYNGSVMWQIDDVEVAGLPQNDLQAEGTYAGSGVDTLKYYQIPIAQVAPITSGGFAKNIGLLDQTNVKFVANETVEGTYTSESTPASILVGATDTLIVGTPFEPTAKGDYKIEYSVVAEEADDAPNNNVFKPYEFTVGDYIYARDNSTDAESGTVHGSLPTYGVQGTSFITKYAVLYEVNADADLTAIDFQFGNRITEGAQVQVKLLADDADNLIAEGAFYTAKAGDEGTYHTLAFDTPVQLTAGTEYYAAVEVFDDSLSIATGGVAKTGTSLFYYEGAWSNLSPSNPTYVIRMNFDPIASVENNDLSNLDVTQFPNPFANETTVRFSLEEASNVSYTITDMTGKVIADVNKGNLMTGDHEIKVNGSSMANGIYYFNLKTDNGQVTRKMVVNK